MPETEHPPPEDPGAGLGGPARIAAVIEAGLAGAAVDSWQFVCFGSGAPQWREPRAREPAMIQYFGSVADPAAGGFRGFAAWIGCGDIDVTVTERNPIFDTRAEAAEDARQAAAAVNGAAAAVAGWTARRETARR